MSNLDQALKNASAYFRGGTDYLSDYDIKLMYEALVCDPVQGLQHDITCLVRVGQPAERVCTRCNRKWPACTAEPG